MKTRRDSLASKPAAKKSAARTGTKARPASAGRTSGSTSTTTIKAPPIAGIGASAGGLEAFTQLLGALPTDTGMAFVLVQHLEPRHESILTKLLARATRMPVVEVREGMRAEPNHVYVIPANTDLSLIDGLLHVVGRKASPGHHLPINYFFHTLAEAQGPRAFGVILSGTASDGTEGLQAIKLAGGVTFAQQPETAKFDGMPRSAIAAGCVDFVLPPGRIATELARIAHHPLLATLTPEQIPPVPGRETEWARLFRLLRTATGVDFTFYKKSTIQRRLARRMALHKAERMSAYLKLLERDPSETEALFREILIHVTSFFREPEVFAALEDEILPRITRGKPMRDPIRIWVPGCSTGEEAYSIAICVLEFLDTRASDIPVQVFATDISDAAIERARSGIYSEDALRELSTQRLHRFFTRINSHYQVNSSVRELCVFARHDVTRDPPFSKLDLISCRNVLIYFEAALQKKVLASFHYGLKSTGVLILGKTESLGAFTNLFSVTDRIHKFFAKNMTARPPLEPVQTAFDTPISRVRATLEAPPVIDLEKEADRAVWERYAHAGLVVNNDLQILHFRGDTSPYLRPIPGKATFNLPRMLREELVMELRGAIQKARKTGASVRAEGIRIKHNRETETVNVEVRPLPVPDGHERSFLILFEKAPRGEHQRTAATAGPRPSRRQEVVKLENELARSRDYVQAIIREQESTNEELKTANEEALSSMEELQSTNEELETAKEELQSSNEELLTLNEQLQNRNTELGHLTDDLSNVLSGVDIPILILDADRHIRRFTFPAQKLLSLLPGDIGRSIDNLRFGLNVPDLKNLTAKVIENGVDERREVQSEDGRWYSMRIRPFRTGEQKIEGVLMAFVDIDDLKQSQQALQKERNTISAVLDTARGLLVLVLDLEGRIIQFNRVCQELTGYAPDEALGRRLWDFLPVPEQAVAVKESLEQAIKGNRQEREDYWITKDHGRRLIAWSSDAVLSDSGAVESVIVAGIDQTQRDEAQLQARESEARVRALLETAAHAIVAADSEGKIVLTNATSESLFGYDRRDLIGQPLETLVPERLRQRHIVQRKNWFAQPLKRPMGTGLELIGRHRDGTEFPIEVSLDYLRERRGTLGVASISDITERRKNEEMVLDYQKQLQSLAASLITAQESGNRELARELHDVYSQQLAALVMEVSTVLDSDRFARPQRQRLTDLRRKLGMLAEDIHRTSRQLHPAILEELGLVTALREQCDTFSQQTGTPLRFTATKVPDTLPDAITLCLYRIAQEGLRNIRKHATAKDVRVALAGAEDSITLRIEDAGIGFDPAQARKRGGLGLISMEERAKLVTGKFNIQSQPGRGTTVEVVVPLGNTLGASASPALGGDEKSP